MHLFLIDLYVSVDMLSPIIHVLNKKQKVLICGINPNQSFKEDKIINSVINKNVKYDNFIPIGNFEKILLSIVDLIKLLPNFIQKKIKFFWEFLYKKKVFSNVSIIEKYLKKNNISSITYEESSAEKYVELFFIASKKMKIPMIKIDSGIAAIKTPLSKNRLENSNYFISPSYFMIKNKILKNKKLRYIGSIRFTKYWLKILDKIFKIEKVKDKKIINVGFFTKYQSKENPGTLKLIEKLKKENFVNIKTREKPRDLYPLKFAYFYREDYNSSQLIRWSDIIVSSRSTSVLAEALIRNKKVVLLKYLYDESKFSNLYKYKYIKKINKEKDLIKNIFAIRNNKKFLRSKNKCLKDILVDHKNEKKIINDYIKLYSSL